MSPSHLPIRYPLEYFAAPIAFAQRLAVVAGLPALDCALRYTPLREELTGSAFQAIPSEAIWDLFVTFLERDAPLALSHRIHALYRHQPWSRFDPTWAPKGTARFGSLGADTSPYNLEKHQVKLHFLPTRIGGSDLTSSRLDERRGDMSQLLRYVRARYPQVHSVRSCTWLHHVPTYRALFPQSFSDRLAPERDQFLGLWGQFVTWDGQGNQARYKTFIQALQVAQSFDEIVDAIPLKVRGANRPIEEFYQEYGIG